VTASLLPQQSENAFTIEKKGFREAFREICSGSEESTFSNSNAVSMPFQIDRRSAGLLL
jgi:hypothetical protein